MENVAILNVLQTLDDGLISLDNYQRLYTMLSEAVEMMGHPVRGKDNCCPLPSTKKIQEANKSLNAYILQNHDIKPLRDSKNPDTVLGYHADVEQTLKFMADANGYTPSLYTGKDYDTLVLAFAYDKCPFLHNGRGLLMGHVEDLTTLANWGYQKIIPSGFKSNKNNWFLCAFEMKKEHHDGYKVCSNSFCYGLFALLSHLPPPKDAFSFLAQVMQAHEYGLKARNVVRLKKEEIRQLEIRYVSSEDAVERASLEQEIQRLKKWLDERYKLLSMKVSFCATPHINRCCLLIYFFS